MTYVFRAIQYLVLFHGIFLIPTKEFEVNFNYVAMLPVDLDMPRFTPPRLSSFINVPLKKHG